MKTVFLVFVLTIVSGNAVAKDSAFRVLVPDSYVGAGSLTEALEKQILLKCPGCKVQWVSTKLSSGLWGRIRGDFARKRHSDYSAVLGLDELYFKWGQSKQYFQEGEAFDRSPYSFIVDSQKIPQKTWPKSWKELPARFESQVLIQDPRLSSPGLGWLFARFSNSLFDVEVEKKIVKRIFSSWSSSYQAFLSGEAPVVWSYLSSEAYHRCQQKTESPRYRALPLEEGYPEQREYLALMSWAPASEKKEYQRLKEILLSESFQKEIPLLNWMFPIKNVPLPECYQALPKQKVLLNKAVDEKSFQNWLDLWSL